MAVVADTPHPADTMSTEIARHSLRAAGLINRLDSSKAPLIPSRRLYAHLGGYSDYAPVSGAALWLYAPLGYMAVCTSFRCGHSWFYSPLGYMTVCTSFRFGTLGCMHHFVTWLYAPVSGSALWLYAPLGYMAVCTSFRCGTLVVCTSFWYGTMTAPVSGPALLVVFTTWLHGCMRQFPVRHSGCMHQFLVRHYDYAPVSGAALWLYAPLGYMTVCTKFPTRRHGKKH